MPVAIYLAFNARGAGACQGGEARRQIVQLDGRLAFALERLFDERAAMGQRFGLVQRVEPGANF